MEQAAARTDWAAWYEQEGRRSKEPSLFGQMVAWYRENPTKPYPRKGDGPFLRNLAERAEQWVWREKWLESFRGTQ